MHKLTQEQVLSLPEMIKEKGLNQVARELGVHRVTIQSWAKRLRELGHEIPKGKRGRKPLLP